MDKASNKQKIIIQSVCILLSIGLWIYVTSIENPIRPYSLRKVPVKLVNVGALEESNLALVPNIDYYVTLEVEGQSQELFNMERNDFKLEVDLSEYALNVGQRKVPVKIVDSPENVKVKNSISLAIDLKIEELLSKEVPVKSQIDVVAESSYYVANPVFYPNTVTVTGPASLVNKVESVIARGKEENANKTIVKNYIITAIDKDYEEVEQVKLSQEWIEATININKGRNADVIVNTTGKLDENLKLISIEPDIESIEMVGAEEILNNISQVYTEVIDLSKIKDTTAIEVKIIMPSGVKSNSRTNVNVKVNVQKKITKEFTIKTQILGLDDTMMFKSLSENIKVTIKGFEEDISLIKEENLKATLDISNISSEGKYSEVPVVVIEGLESKAVIDSITKVEFELSQKDSSLSTAVPNEHLIY